MMNDADTRACQATYELVERPTNHHIGINSTKAASEAVTRIHPRFNDKPIRDFVPVLVERLARQEPATRTGA